jgi:hypothetical protein
MYVPCHAMVTGIHIIWPIIIFLNYCKKWILFYELTSSICHGLLAVPVLPSIWHVRAEIPRLNGSQVKSSQAKLEKYTQLFANVRVPAELVAAVSNCNLHADKCDDKKPKVCSTQWQQ